MLIENYLENDHFIDAKNWDAETTHYAGEMIWKRSFVFSVVIGLSSTLIRHENGAFRKRSINRRNSKTLALIFSAGRRTFWERSFSKTMINDLPDRVFLKHKRVDGTFDKLYTEVSKEVLTHTHKKNGDGRLTNLVASPELRFLPSLSNATLFPSLNEFLC